MTHNVIVPEDLWEDDLEAAVTSILVEQGTKVSKGQLILEVMVEKSQYEILSDKDGVINILVEEDDVIEKGAIVAEVIE